MYADHSLRFISVPTETSPETGLIGYPIPVYLRTYGDLQSA
ncbi:conserved hypothetical protein [Xenorhabdus nematophila str. Anatoliense]|nr:conserved hypothetical protein [Xenorhabdus nematophila str. Anatoliense]CEE93403.1 conserved hypothetical protein [Xenorhabdus nematophila str. Anatoliense]